jgi:hypothetical protein
MRAVAYRSYALECFALARAMDGLSCKGLLLDMAQNWLALAELAEKNAKVELVYQPLPRLSIVPQADGPGTGEPD